jgi:hypothetical protein
MAAAAGDGPTDQLCQQLQQDMQAQFGFAANTAWLQQCVTQLLQEHAGFSQQPRSMQLQLLLEQLLMADFRMAGAGGVLPQNIKVTCCTLSSPSPCSRCLDLHSSSATSHVPVHHIDQQPQVYLEIPCVKQSACNTTNMRRMSPLSTVRNSHH